MCQLQEDVGNPLGSQVYRIGSERQQALQQMGILRGIGWDGPDNCVDDDSVFSRFNFYKVKSRSKPLNLQDYISPLTRQVEALEPTNKANKRN